jgi:hypothetical protein
MRNRVKVVNGYTIGPDEQLSFAYLEGADLSDCDLTGANLTGAILTGANLSDSILVRTNFSDADLEGAHLEGSVLKRALFVRANLRDAHFEGANLERAWMHSADATQAFFNNAKLVRTIWWKEPIVEQADFTGADFTGALIEGVDFSNAKVREAFWDGAAFNDETVWPEGFYPFEGKFEARRLLGRQTGAILKLLKPDAPRNTRAFMKKYPAEFERLRGELPSSEFDDKAVEAIRGKSETPFLWHIRSRPYEGDQRTSRAKHTVYTLSINLEDPSLSEEDAKTLTQWRANHTFEDHPWEPLPYFTIGWVRVAKINRKRLWLIEEVQTDLDTIRFISPDSFKAGFDALPERDRRRIAKKDSVARWVFDLLAPYGMRFYDDAVALVLAEAQKHGVEVEMLRWEDKAKYNAPTWAYSTLPKRLGMVKRETKTGLKLQGRVSHYDPNPSFRGRGWRYE